MGTLEVQLVDSQQPFKLSVSDKVAQWYENHADVADSKKQDFLSALKELGIVRRAIEASHLDRRIVYTWRNSDPDFRKAWDDALEDVTDTVEHSLYDMAVSRKNVVAAIVWLKAHRAKYRDRLAIDVNSLDREIEDRLSSMDDSTKGIITQAIGGPPQQLTE